MAGKRAELDKTDCSRREASLKHIRQVSRRGESDLAVLRPSGEHLLRQQEFRCVLIGPAFGMSSDHSRANARSVHANAISAGRTSSGVGAPSNAGGARGSAVYRNDGAISVPEDSRFCALKRPVDNCCATVFRDRLDFQISRLADA